MYAQRAFQCVDETAALALARNYNFAALLTPSRALISHLPVMIDNERRVIRGHLARANPHAAEIDGASHTLIFTGPNAYVSPDWYGPNSPDVPTWNYAVAHLSGVGKVIDDRDAVIALLTDLSDQEELRRHDLESGKIWSVAKMPEGKLEAMAHGIVAFEISIDKVEAIMKLSQNKPPEAVSKVADALAHGNEAQRAVAALMRAQGPERNAKS